MYGASSLEYTHLRWQVVARYRHLQKKILKKKVQMKELGNNRKIN